jgi:hypothetical protein
MIKMHVYLPEKYRSPSLHGVSPFLKSLSLIVSFDGSFNSCLLESYLAILTSKGDQHASLSTNLYLKDCQLCIISHVFLEEESWSQPYMDCPPV